MGNVVENDFEDPDPVVVESGTAVVDGEAKSPNSSSSRSRIEFG